MSEERFEGFTPPVDDYFRMPNTWINICAHIDSMSELKVVQYVLRHTWGYQGFSGARKITIDEFMHGRKRKDGSRIDEGTGLSKQSVITAVETAIKHGYLVCDKDDKDLARQKKYYQLAMKSGVKPLDSNSDVKDLDISLDVNKLDISDVKDLDHEVKGLDSSGLNSRHRSEKDTLERHLQKDTLERQGESAQSLRDTAQTSNGTDTPPAVIDFEAKKAESDARLKAVTPSGKHPVVDVNATFASQGIDPEETVRHPAIRVNVKPQGDNNHAAVHDAGNSDAGAGGSLPGHTDADRVPAHPGAAAPVAAAYAAHGDTRGDRLAVPAATPAAAKEPPDTSLDACSGPLFSGHDGAAPPRTAGSLSPSVSSQPRASGASIPPLSVQGETPRPLTRKQQEKLHDGIKAEYWAVIEAWKGASYTRDQRLAPNHTSGIDAMLANGVLPDDLRVKLGKLDAFQRRTFTVNKLYLDWWNNLDEQVPAKPANGKARGKPVEDENDPYSFASILKRQEQQAASA